MDLSYLVFITSNWFVFKNKKKQGDPGSSQAVKETWVQIQSQPLCDFGQIT